MSVNEVALSERAINKKYGSTSVKVLIIGRCKMSKINKKNYKASYKIRYIQEGHNTYSFTINKRNLPSYMAARIFGVSEVFYQKTLLETFNANVISYPTKYVFKTKQQAKDAVEWLRTLIIAKELSCK